MSNRLLALILKATEKRESPTKILAAFTNANGDPLVLINDPRNYWFEFPYQYAPAKADCKLSFKDPRNLEHNDFLQRKIQKQQRRR